MSREDSDAFIDRIEAPLGRARLGQLGGRGAGRRALHRLRGLWPADYVANRPMVEVGWRLAREHWGHGYATEAAREALRFGFEEVGLEEIVSFTVPQNVRSRRVMERIGLISDPAGDFDHPRVDPVAYPHLVGHVFYRLGRDQWRASRPFPE